MKERKRWMRLEENWQLRGEKRKERNSKKNFGRKRKKFMHNSSWKLNLRKKK
jgi:hypothetical protein